MMLFELKAPDGRTIRSPASSLVELKDRLIPGYEVVGRVICGVVEPIEGPSLMKQLLDAHGEELREWLRQPGTVFDELRAWLKDRG